MYVLVPFFAEKASHKLPPRWLEAFRTFPVSLGSVHLMMFYLGSRYLGLADRLSSISYVPLF